MSGIETAKFVDVQDDALAAIDACYENGWTDGTDCR